MVNERENKLKIGRGKVSKKLNSLKKSGGRLAKKSKMSLYSSLVYKSRADADRRARKKAEELAKLPKEPLKRFLARLEPKKVASFIFSREGAKAILKGVAVLALLGMVLIGGLFLYYKKDLDAVKLDELKVSETVNRYLDRNGKVLWEDKGNGDYRLVVKGNEISTYMRQATVAIEDRNFYNHPGVDMRALIRATASTLTGRGVQGGSTLTQQLIKQIYFSDEAKNRSLSGLPRKIKEMILSIEVEKMYNKEQLITMYLNESPYGGRRNGVQSAAQTYFGKNAKELNLAESALLAAIPNNPGILNPYNRSGNKALIERQRKTLDAMVDMGYISEKEAKKAKKVAILDQIKPEVEQMKDIKAPHFVLETRKKLEEKYGVKTMRAGGFTIKTTLDYKAQEMAEKAVQNGANLMYVNGSDNISLSSVDVETGQIIAMVGSSGWDKPIYGQVNAATSLLEPGSTIKPILDYTPLFTQRDGQNFGPGSVLRDENIDSIYCAGAKSGCQLRNYSGRFSGDVTARQALASSLNIPAVKALYINGVKNSLKIAHGLGDKSYCKKSNDAGLAIAIGSGCSVMPIEHANTYASLARGGVYKPLSYVLEVKNSSGDVLESWQDKEGKRVVDEQVAYMVQDILGDPAARAIGFGGQGYSFGFNVPGVWTGSKTGTTTTSVSSVTKDSWMASFSPAVATVVWNGNHDGRGLNNSSNTVVRRVVADYMEPVHKNLYATNGKWKTGQKPVKPAGIQYLSINGRKDIWPSWFNAKKSGAIRQTLEFNKYNKKLASSCTADEYKISVEVTKTIDPISKREIWFVPDGYDRNNKDDCSYRPPEISLMRSGKKLSFSLAAGSQSTGQYELIVDGATVDRGTANGGTNSLNYSLTCKENSIKLTLQDGAGYTATDEMKPEAGWCD